jgi:hypothetical protein
MNAKKAPKRRAVSTKRASQKTSTKRTAKRRTAAAPRAAATRPGGAVRAPVLISRGHLPPGLSHPKLQKLADHITRALEVMMEKAVANVADPARYPLPRDRKAVEHRLQPLVASLPAAQRREIAQKVMPRVQAVPPIASAGSALLQRSICGRRKASPSNSGRCRRPRT